MLKAYLYTFLMLFFSVVVKGQETESPFRNFGGRVGLQFTIGQPVKRLGLVFNAYYQRDWFQINGNF